MLDAKLIPITEDTTLNENDLIGCWELIEGKECYCEWRILGTEHDLFEGMIPIQEMSRAGKALKKDARVIISVPFDHFIENKFSLLLDKSYDQINWPKSLDEAVSKLKLQFTEEQLLEIQHISQEEFETKYFSFGSWIRNHFGLWRGNFTLLLDCDEENPEPDNVASVIQKYFWKSLQIH